MIKGSKLTIEQRKKVGDVHRGKPKSTEHRLKLSISHLKTYSDPVRLNQATAKRMITLAKNENNPHKNYKRGIYNSFKVPNQTIYYQSSYEKRAFEILDQNQTITTYSRPGFAIPYVDKDTLKIRHYIPDILANTIDDQKLLIEIKSIDMAYKSEIQQRLVAGMLYAIDHNMTYEIWTEYYLGIIKDNAIAKYVR